MAHKRLKLSKDANRLMKKKIAFKSFGFSSSDFSEIVKSPAFVDKTLLLEKVLCGEKMILITAPRRFGKSTNLNMVKQFVEIQVNDNGVVIDRNTSPNRKIFENSKLLIFLNKELVDEHFATYPVIKATFKDVAGRSYDEVLSSFRSVLNNTYSEHLYLLKSKIWSRGDVNIETFKKYLDTEKCRSLDEDEIKKGLQFLSQCLFYHFNNKKIFVLIDEYDAPINNTMFKKEIDINAVNNLLAVIFSQILKDNPFVERALLTGISYFASVALSKANNVEKYMFLSAHPFVPYYGLTDDEVNKLLTKFEIDSETKKKVKLHYNGYVSVNGIKLFSIWSILHFLKENQIESYWEESGVITNLKEALNIPVIRCSIETLCLGMSVEINIFKTVNIDDIIQLQTICLQKASVEKIGLVSPDIYLSFILQQGYLTIEKQISTKFHTVRIPNAAILDQFRDQILLNYGPSINCCIENCAESFKKISSSSENVIFVDFIAKFNEVLDTLKKRFLKHNEDTYHCVVFFILCKTKFPWITEFGGRIGRVDLVVCVDDLGIIIELKHKKTSKEALNQSI